MSADLWVREKKINDEIIRVNCVSEGMSHLLKASKMELIEKIPIKIDRKLVSIPLPEKLILYAVDSSHILLAMKPKPKQHQFRNQTVRIIVSFYS